MVQAKHKKSNPKKKQHGGVKKHGKQADIGQLHSQLDALGLKIIRVTADGNCFFRALADQLEGTEQEHKKYRCMVVRYIMNHREDFEAFIEDDVPFDEYCQSMEKDGTWAGHMELQAASLVTRQNICIHRILSPRWYIRNFSGREASMIHLSYHDGEHYNSVRLKEDSCEGPAMPIIIKVDISAMGLNKKVTTNESNGSSRKSFSDSGSIKLVMAGTGCENIDKIEQILQEVDGDVDAAIEFLIAEQELIEDNNYADSISCERNGDDQNGNCEQPVVSSRDLTCEQNVSSSNIQLVQDHSSQQHDKKMARNKECSCGSKKKYKACCGSAAGKFSAAPVINNKCSASARNGGIRKETKRSRRKEAIGGEVSERASRSLPDLGALCI